MARRGCSYKRGERFRAWRRLRRVLVGPIPGGPLRLIPCDEERFSNLKPGPRIARNTDLSSRCYFSRSIERRDDSPAYHEAPPGARAPGVFGGINSLAGRCRGATSSRWGVGGTVPRILKAAIEASPAAIIETEA